MMQPSNTPIKLVDSIICKCEYLNPTGSVKDRGMAYSVGKLKESKVKKAVISSSGNAGISAAAYCKDAGISLTVFISPHIHPAKRDILESFDCEIRESFRPISQAFKYAKETGGYNLRQSTDPNAVHGFSTISFELLRDVPLADAIFIPVSSATTMVGIAMGYKEKGSLPAVHAVQTQAVNPVARQFDKDFIPASKSIADAIVARVTQRRQEALSYIRKSKGSGWVIDDSAMKNARVKLLSFGIDCSFEGVAAFVAVEKAQKHGFIYKNPVVLLTGKYYGTL